MRQPERPSLEVRRLRGLIRSFFADYLRIVERDVAAELRLDDITLRRKPVDGVAIVAETASRQGEKVTVLVRIEPEGLTPAETSLRLVESVRGLRLPYGDPVLASTVYLQGGRPGVRLESGVIARAAGIELALVYYTTFGLAASRAEHYLERPEPLAWALAARMQPTQRTLDEHRRACLDRIAAAALDEKRRALLRRYARTRVSPGYPRPDNRSRGGETVIPGV
jgi:hypothetical protein